MARFWSARSGNLLNLTMQLFDHAQQAATPKAQQIIWQDFLSAASDSTCIKLAIAQLAQSMLAQVDSKSSAEQVKSTLRFLEQHEAVLRSQFGGEMLNGEMRRVKLLQELKKQTLKVRVIRRRLVRWDLNIQSAVPNE